VLAGTCPRFHDRTGFRLDSALVIPFAAPHMSSLPTADLLALDLDGLKARLSKLRRYL
jgi:hypothetical protein